MYLYGTTLSGFSSGLCFYNYDSTLYIYSNCTITAPMGGYAGYISGTSAVSLSSSSTIQDNATTEHNSELIRVAGSSTFTLKGGTILNQQHNMAVRVDDSSEFIMTSGTITNSHKNALRTNSTANPSIYITGGTINHTSDSYTSDGETRTYPLMFSGISSTVYIKITGGTLKSDHGAIYGASDEDETTGAADIIIGSTSSVSTTTPTLVAYDNYVFLNETSNTVKDTIYGGRLYSSKSSYSSSCSDWHKSGYSLTKSTATYNNVSLNKWILTSS